MFSKTLFPAFANFASKTLHLNILGANCNKINSAPHLDLVRYAARKGTRAKADAKKRALKLKLQSQPKPQVVPKFLQRKTKLTPESQRVRCTNENWLETQPIDNVYSLKLYRGNPYPFQEAIQMHRDVHAPAMLNAPSALVYANIELDLKMKKANKLIEDINGIISYPHSFKTIKKNKVIVVCQNVEDQQKATDAGAIYAGSKTLIKQILSGAVQRDEFDYVICHPDILKDCNTLRGILGRKFPNTHNGLLRLDIENAVTSFINGTEYTLSRSVVELDFGWVDVAFGRLDMPIEQLEENFKITLTTIEKHKPPQTDDRLFNLRTQLFCELSREKFKVPHWQYLPNYPENGVLKVESEEEVKDEKKESASAQT